MIKLVNRLSIVAAILTTMFLFGSARGETTWTGTGTNNVLTGANWLGGVVPGPTTTGTGGPGTDGGSVVGQADFVNGINPVMNAAWSTRYIAFFGNINSLSGTGTLTIGNGTTNAGNIDSWKATGPVTISVANIVLQRNSSIYAASNGGGTADLIIDSGTLKWGAGSGSNTSGNVSFFATGGNLTVNPKVDFTSVAVTRRLLPTPNAGKTITITNGVTDGGSGRLDRIVTGGQYGGTTILGGDSSGWGGLVLPDISDLIIVSNNALGSVGSISGVTGFTEPSGGSSTAALMLSNSLVPTGITSGESIFLGPRTVDTAPQIVNLSGHNTLSGTIAADGANSSSTQDTGYALEARGAVGVDIFELSGTIGKSNYCHGAGTLTLRGTGSGLVSGVITSTILGGNGTQEGGTWGVTKKDAGTWTFTNANTYTGLTSVEEGTLAVTGTGSLANSSGIAVSSGAFFDVSSHSGGGLTLANAQKLSGTGTVTGSITSGTGSSIAPGASIGTLTISNALSLAGGSTMQYELTDTPTSLGGINDKLVIGGDLSLAGTTTVAVTQTNGSLGNGTYTLMTYGGSLVSGGAGNFALSGIGSGIRKTYTFSTATANQVNLLVAGPGTPSANLIWAGNGTTNPWDTVTTADWTGAGDGDNRFYAGDSVTFDDTGSNSPNINVVGTVSPANITFNNSSGHAYTFTGGTVSASGDFSSTSSGDVTFSNAVTSVAGTFNVAGSANVNVTAGNFSVAGATTMGTGTLTFSNTGGSISLPSTVTVSGGTVVFNRTDNLTGASALASGFSGSGSLVKQNTNVVELSGDNSGFSSGTATVQAGRLRIASPNGLMSTTVNNNATLEFTTGAAGAATTGSSTKTVSIIGTGASGAAGALAAYSTSGSADINAHVGNLTLAGDVKIAVTNSGGTGRSIIWTDAAIIGGGNNLHAVVDTSVNAGNEIDMINNGVTNLNNVTITGGGPLYLGKNTDLGSTGKVILGDGTTNGSLAFYAGAATNATTVVGNFSKPLEVASGSRGGLIYYYNQDVAVDSTISVNSGATFEAITSTRSNSTNSTITLTNAITGLGGFAAHCDNSTSATTSRQGTVYLTSDTNTYAGPTVIGGGSILYPVTTLAANDRITLSVGNGGTTGSIGAGNITVNGPTNGTAWLQLNRRGTYALANNIALNGTANGANIYQIGDGNAQFTPSDVTLSGNITGIGRVIVDNPVSSLTLSGNNTFTGDVNDTGRLDINSGHLIAASNTALGQPGTNKVGYVQLFRDIGNTSALLLTNSVTINKTVIYMGQPRSTNAANVGPNIISVSGSNELSGTIASDGGLPDSNNKYYTIQSNSGSTLTLSGSIRQDYAGQEYLTLRGAGNGVVSGSILQPATNFYTGGAVTGNIWHVIKEDAGTWTLSGANAYTGDTFVNGGTLVNTSAFLANTADVLLKTGATLNLSFAGTDTIDSLFFNNSPQATGLWGAVGSGATHESSLIFGTGTLMVSSFGGIPGDYNVDTKVNAADFVLWRKDPASYNGAAGYGIWRANFGNPPGAGSGAGLDGGAVPEPATCGLVLCVVIGMLSRCRPVRRNAA